MSEGADLRDDMTHYAWRVLVVDPHKIRSARGPTHWMPFVVSALLLWTNSANADLEAGRALSLEWLVDSSDEIALVSIEQTSSSASPLGVVLSKQLKGGIAADTVRQVLAKNEPALYRWRDSRDHGRVIEFRRGNDRWYSASHAADGDEWLLFLRQPRGKPLYIVHAIDLVRPRERSVNAAVTADSRALGDKGAILTAVGERLALKRKLPPNCRRELIDQWDLSDGIVHWSDETGEQDFYWQHDEVAAIRGGLAIHMNCDYWDRPTDPADRNEGMIIMRGIVPADEKYFPVLVKRLEGYSDIRYERALACDVYALLNYPGEKTERFLQNMVDELDARGRRTHVWRDAYFAARRVLTHLRYLDDASDPLNKKLVGDWTLYGTQERIELELRPDQRCRFVSLPKDPARPRVMALGHWIVRDGRFWFCRSHHIKRGQWQKNRRTYFEPKKIEKLTADAVVIQGGPPMRRRNGWTLVPPQLADTPVNED